MVGYRSEHSRLEDKFSQSCFIQEEFSASAEVRELWRLGRYWPAGARVFRFPVLIGLTYLLSENNLQQKAILVSRGQRWELLSPNQEVVASLDAAEDFPTSLAATLANRGIEDPNMARRYLSPGL